MKIALALLLLAAPAFAQQAQQHAFIAYQNALLARAQGADKALASACDSLGPVSDANRAQVQACQVTRLFLSDLAKNKDQGYPPMTSSDYLVNQNEVKLLSDAQTKYRK